MTDQDPVEIVARALHEARLLRGGPGATTFPGGISSELDWARLAAEFIFSSLKAQGMVVVPEEQTQAGYDGLSSHDKMWRGVNSAEVYRVLVKAEAAALKEKT